MHSACSRPLNSLRSKRLASSSGHLTHHFIERPAPPPPFCVCLFPGAEGHATNASLHHLIQRRVPLSPPSPPTAFCLCLFPRAEGHATNASLRHFIERPLPFFLPPVSVSLHEPRACRKRLIASFHIACASSATPSHPPTHRKGVLDANCLVSSSSSSLIL